MRMESRCGIIQELVYTTHQHLKHCYGTLPPRPKSVLWMYTVSTLAIVAWLALIAIRLVKKYALRRGKALDPENTTPKSPARTRTLERTSGLWIPSAFKRPRAQPYPNWDVYSTKPLPYRPFKYGSYHITMGLRTMKWDDWIELDDQFPKFHADKIRRIKERGPRCCKTAPEAFDGAVELLEELYALYFSRHAPRRAS